MKKPFERVLLHIGPPKTGTTSIQQFLAANRTALRDRGFYVPKTASLGPQQIKLPLLFGPRHAYQERLTGAPTGPTETQREAVASAFAAEAADAGSGHTLLISSEHLFAADPAAIDSYRQFFAPYVHRFESLTYLRRQDRWMVSRVLQARKTGARGDIHLGSGPTRAFEQAVRLWSASSDHCEIRRFDDSFLINGSLLEDFCEQIGCEIAGLATDGVRNRALLQEQLELVDALNGALEMPVNKQIAYRIRFLPLCTEVLGGTRFEFSRQAARKIFADYSQVNTWLRDTIDPEGPSEYFKDDFDDYPEEPTNGHLYSIDQLLRLAEAINVMLRKHHVYVARTPDAENRARLVRQIVASFIRLRAIELEQIRVTRRAGG